MLLVLMTSWWEEARKRSTMVEGEEHGLFCLTEAS